MRVSRLRRTWHNGMDEPRPTPGFRSMATRTTSKTVTFHRPFRLKGVDRPLPPATHRVLTEEDLIEGLSFPAYRRVSTAIFVPAPTGSAVEMVMIDPADLQAAQEQDAATPNAAQEQDAAVPNVERKSDQDS